MIIVGIRNGIITEDLFNKKLPFQCINADVVCTKKHIQHSINQSLSKKRITNNIFMEILVRCSAQRQISVAIKKLGVPLNKKSNICLVCENKEVLNKILPEIGGEIDNSVLELNNNKIKKIMEVYNIKNFVSKEDLIMRVCEKISLIEVI